jgi:DNA (cytosine-5)-methyltransferase 1
MTNETQFVAKKINNYIEKNGKLPEFFNPYNSNDCGNIAPTQTTYCGSTTSNSTVLFNDNSRIRKLTPKECWRLMGFDDVDFDRAKNSGVSNSQLYKQAGNSIVVNVLMAIFKEMI